MYLLFIVFDDIHWEFNMLYKILLYFLLTMVIIKRKQLNKNAWR